MDQDFPLPVCPYAKIVPLNPSKAWATMGMPKNDHNHDHNQHDQMNKESNNDDDSIS